MGEMQVIKGNRLSVIISGYNMPVAWWERCVKSVQRACETEDEIICVDDCSPERPFFLYDVAASDHRIKIAFREKNGGPPCVRNTGLALATGDYIAFVDGDDAVKGDVLRRSVERLVETGDDIAFYGVETIWVTDGLQKIDVPPDKSWGSLSPSDVLMISRMTLFNYVWNKVYDRSFLTRNDIWFEPRSVATNGRALVFGGEDCAFNLRCVMAAAKWCSLSDVGYSYYRPRISLLSLYKASNQTGTVFVSAVWRKYKDATVGARDVLGDFGEVSERALMESEWRNIWRPHSPYSFWSRWCWLRNSTKQSFIRCFSKYISRAIYTLLRRHFYIRAVRRWNIRRLYPYATEWRGQE